MSPPACSTCGAQLGGMHSRHDWGCWWQEGDEGKDHVERDERRLGELGRRTVEMFSMAHIFSELEVCPFYTCPG